MAAWILQAADHRAATQNSTIMIHVGEVGYESDHPNNIAARVQYHEAQEKRLVAMLAERIQLTSTEVSDLLEFDKIYTAQEAYTLGLLDEVLN